MRTWIIVGIALTLSLGCARSSSYTHTQITSSCVFRGGEAGRYRIRVENGVGAFVAHRNGELLGVEAREEIEPAAMMSAVRVERWVDFPELPTWRRQLADAEALAAGDGGAGPLVDALAALPFQELGEEPMARWIREDENRAAEALDEASRAGFGGAWIGPAVSLAVTADGLDDARLAQWVEAVLRSGPPESIERIVEAPAAGAATYRAALDAIDERSGSERLALWVSVGSRAVGDPEGEAKLVETIDELFGSDRKEAALAVLTDPRATPVLARAFLEDIDEFFGSDRADVYIACARILAPDPASHGLIHDRLDELFGSDRERAALGIIRDPDSPPALSAGFTRVIDDFFASARDEVLRAIIALPGYEADETIQRACLQASDELYQRDREKVLRTMADDPRTIPAVRRAARAALDG